MSPRQSLCEPNKKSEVMVVMTDVMVALAAVLNFPADVIKHLKEFCPLISGLSGTIKDNEVKKSDRGFYGDE